MSQIPSVRRSSLTLMKTKIFIVRTPSIHVPQSAWLTLIKWKLRHSLRTHEGIELSKTLTKKASRYNHQFTGEHIKPHHGNTISKNKIGKFYRTNEPVSSINKF